MWALLVEAVDLADGEGPDRVGEPVLFAGSWLPDLRRLTAMTAILRFDSSRRRPPGPGRTWNCCSPGGAGGRRLAAGKA